MQFDKASFSKAIKNKQAKIKGTMRPTAKIIGIAASTLCRIETGEKLPDLTTYAKVCKWLDVNMEKFFKK